MTYNNLVINAIYFVSVLLSYIILVSMAGYLRALVAKWMGDDTAEQQGFLTLNPGVHIDIVGALVLIFSYLYSQFCFGWGRQTPLNPANIQGRLRWLKLSIAMLSGVIVYFLFAVLGLVLVAYIMGPVNALGTSGASAYTPVPVISILHRFIAMCIFLATMELVINIVLLGMLFVIERYENAWQYASYAVLIIPILIFLVYGTQIQILLATGITSLAHLLAKLFFRS